MHGKQSDTCNHVIVNMIQNEAYLSKWQEKNPQNDHPLLPPRNELQKKLSSSSTQTCNCQQLSKISVCHCVKSFRIWSYSGTYSVRMPENADRNNSKYGHFSCIERYYSIYYHVNSLPNIMKHNIKPSFQFSSTQASCRFDLLGNH